MHVHAILSSFVFLVSFWLVAHCLEIRCCNEQKMKSKMKINESIKRNKKQRETKVAAPFHILNTCWSFA
jgi:hypothetical protein